MTSAPRSTSAVVTAAGPSIETSTIRTPSSNPVVPVIFTLTVGIDPQKCGSGDYRGDVGRHLSGPPSRRPCARRIGAVEDRLTPGLYLEMTDEPLDAYVDLRVPEVLATAGATGATWWENCVRDRTDLPRKLPEFSHFAVYEVDAG